MTAVTVQRILLTTWETKPQDIVCEEFSLARKLQILISNSKKRKLLLSKENIYSSPNTVCEIPHPFTRK